MPEDEILTETGEPVKPPKKERPQNKNLRPPINKLPPEEQFAMRSKGGKNSQAKRKEKEALKKLVQAALRTKVDKRVISQILTLISMPEDGNGKTRASVAIIGKNIELAMNGSPEARDWLFAHAYPEEFEAYKAAASQQSQVAVGTNAGDSLQIHLIRGQKPEDPMEDLEETPEDLDDE